MAVLAEENASRFRLRGGGSPQSPSLSFRDKINLYLSGIDLRFVGRSARSFVAEPTKVTATVPKQSDAEALDLCT